MLLLPVTQFSVPVIPIVASVVVVGIVLLGWKMRLTRNSMINALEAHSTAFRGRYLSPLVAAFGPDHPSGMYGLQFEHGAWTFDLFGSIYPDGVQSVSIDVRGTPIEYGGGTVEAEFLTNRRGIKSVVCTPDDLERQVEPLLRQFTPLGVSNLTASGYSQSARVQVELAADNDFVPVLRQLLDLTAILLETLTTDELSVATD